MKQPRISAERAKCGSGAQSAFQLFGQPGSMVHHGQSDPEAHGDQHAARGAWPQVSSNAGGSDGGKGTVGSRGGGGKGGEETLIRCVHALCAARAGREKEAPAPFPENTASSCCFQGHAVGQRAQAPAFACCPGGGLFSRVKLFLWYNSAEK